MDGAAGATEADAGRLIPDDVWGVLCIYAEARGEPYEGQVAVGNVIRTRTAKRVCSNGTVCSTVTFPYQFSWMNHNDGQRTKVLSARWELHGVVSARNAWAESERNHIVADATHYHADYVSPEWARANGMHFIKRIGRHLFYVETGR